MIDSHAAAPASRGLRSLAARRPLTVFIVVVLVAGWAIMTPMVLAARGMIPATVPPPLYVLAVNLGVMLPAALWVTSVVDGRAGVRALLARAVRWRFGLVWWAVVLLALPALTIAAALLLGGSFRAEGLVPIAARQIGSMLTAVLLINLWEETVWGGFLQTWLERRHAFLAAAALAALPFAGVHIPLLLAGEHLSVSGFLADLGGLVALAVVARTLWGVVLRGAADSTLAIGLMHGVFNASNNRGQLVDSLLEGANVNAAAMIALAALATLLVLANPGKLSRAYRTDVLDRR